MNTDRAFAIFYLLGAMFPIAFVLGAWFGFFEAKPFVVRAIVLFIYYDIFMAFASLGVIWGIEQAKKKYDVIALKIIKVVVGIAVSIGLLALFAFILTVFSGEGLSAGSDLIDGKVPIPLYAISLFAFMAVKNAAIYWSNQKMFWAKGPGTSILTLIWMLFIGLLMAAVLELFSTIVGQPLPTGEFDFIFILFLSTYFFLTALLLWLPAEKTKQVTLEVWRNPFRPWAWFKHRSKEEVDFEFDQTFIE